MKGFLSHRLDEKKGEGLAEALHHSCKEVEELVLEDGELPEDELEPLGLVLLPLA